MAALQPGSTLRLERPAAFSVGAGWTLAVDGDDRGRIQGTEIEFDDLTLRVQRTGERFELVTGIGTPVLRFDPAGRKATTLTTSSGRFRMARQRPIPLLRRWRVTKSVHGDAMLTASQTPLGTQVKVADDADVAPGELALLAIATVVELLDVEPAAAAA